MAINLFERTIPGTNQTLYGSGLSLPQIPSQQPQPSFQEPSFQASMEGGVSELDSMIEELVKKGYNRKLAKTIAEKKLAKESKPVEIKQEPVEQTKENVKSEDTVSGDIGSAVLSAGEDVVNYLGEGIGNIVGGAVAEAPRVLANTATVASGVGRAVMTPFSPIEGYKKGVEDASFLRKAAEGVSGIVEQYGDYEKDSTGADVGKFVTDVASTAAIPGGILTKTPSLSRAIGQGVIETGKYSAASEGRLPTISEVTTGGITGAASRGFGKVMEYAEKRLPSVGLKGALNAGQRLERSNIDEYKDVNNLSTWLNNKSQEGYSVSGLVENRINAFEKIAEDGLKKNASQVKALDISPDIQTEGAIKRALKDVASKMKKADTSNNLSSEISAFEKLAKKSKFTAEDVFNARKLLGDDSLFTKSGIAKEDLGKKGLLNAWKAAGDWLDDKVPGFRNTNKDVEVAIALSRGLKDAVRTGNQTGIFTPSNLVNLLSMPSIASSIGTGASKLIRTKDRLLQSRTIDTTKKLKK